MVSHLPLPTTPNPFQSPRRTVLHCQLEVWYPDFSVCNAVKASFSHFSLAGSVNSPFQEFGVDFPLHIYNIQCLCFPCPTGFPFPFLISFNQNSAKFCTGWCPWGTVADSLGEKNRKKRGRREIRKRPVGERTVEAKGSCRNSFGNNSRPPVVCSQLLFSKSWTQSPLHLFSSLGLIQL